MASILKVDDLRGNTAAGNITITSEGGSATMQLQQGLAKGWVNADATGTPSITGSLNATSIVDNSAGDFTLNWSNSMANVNYSITGMTQNFAVSSTSTGVLGIKTGTTPASSSVNLTTCRTSSTSVVENGVNCASVFGDLA